MSTARNGLANGGRLLCRLTTAALVLFAVVCTTLPGPLKWLPAPFGESAKNQALRKQAEADSFPTAKQAGL